MKKINPIFLLIILALSVAVYSQASMSGKVVQVIDGKTVVIDTGGSRIRLQIQYVEVPEPEQELSGVVRDHLEKLVLGKTVNFRPNGLSGGKAFGSVYVNHSDIAIQLLRDGAAWHIRAENSGQPESEGAAYEYHQNQAKLENRGVWGVKDLKPAWEFRAEKEQKERQAGVAAEYAASETKNASYTPVEAKRPARKAGAWSDVNPWLKDPGPLVNGYNAATKTGYVGTSLMGVKELENIPPDQKIAVDITYVYKQEDQKGRKGTFVLTLVSLANEWRFLKANTLAVAIDEKNIVIGKPNRKTSNEEGRSIEKLTYEVSKDTIEKIVFGGEVIIKIGDYRIYPSQGLQLLLYNMLQVAG